jgi:hypothetical protein
MKKIFILLFICTKIPLIAQTSSQTYFVSNNNDTIRAIPWNIQEPKFIEGRRVYKAAEQMPQFPGGNEKAVEYIKKNLKEDADDKFVPEIKLTFVVDTDGVCKNVGIIKKTNESKLTRVEITAIDAVKNMPVWKPGKSQGVQVPVQCYLSIDL